MSFTTDRNNPDLGHGVDSSPQLQSKVYLILSEEERAKGFVRPLRRTYMHIGEQPKNPLRDLTTEEQERYIEYNYVKYEEYPKSDSSVVGRFWTQEQLDQKGCFSTTTMARELAETYARDPKFYGSTYCATCRMHRPVREFVWIDDNTQVGE